MKISVIGTGYVGLVTGACFAKLGHDVVCVDTDRQKIEVIMKGVSPLYEEGLQEILEQTVGKKLRATSDTASAVRDTDISFICVGTPSRLNGSIELKFVREAAKQIGRVLRQKKTYHLVVVKSTVAPGTTEKVVLSILEKTSLKEAGKDFGLAMNPEFLKEGVAVHDFIHPDRIVIGGHDTRSNKVLSQLYQGFKAPIIKTDPTTAEMIKYASNAFLATKISFINEIANICKRLGISAYDVAEGMGYDRRIAPQFLKAGPGFGGSCFPKDVKALIAEAKTFGIQPYLMQAVLKVNHEQPLKLVELMRKKLGSLVRKKIGVLGLAFKEDTDDIRESPAIPLIKGLLAEKANVYAYDPKAIEAAREIFGNTIYYENTAESILRKTEGVIVVTPWKEFFDPKLYRGKVIVDGRYIFGNKIPNDLDYEGIGW